MPSIVSKPTRVKAEAIKLVKSLPTDSSWDELMYRIYVRQKIEAGLKDVKEGRIHAHSSIVKEFSRS